MSPKHDRGKPEARYRREMGWLGSFSIGYGDVGPNIFIALGTITIFAGGASPVAFVIAASLYAIVGLIYAELAPTYPYAGGVQVYSMKAFNSLAGFISGWAMMLAYILCISLFSVAAAGYLRQLLPILQFPDLTVNGLTIPSLGLVAGLLASFLVVLNVAGIRYSATMLIALVFLGLLIEAVVLGAGFLLKFDINLFLKQVVVFGSNTPHKDVSYVTFLPTSVNNFLYSITLAMASFVGIESIAQAAEETRRPHFSIPRAAKMLVLVVVLSVVLFSVLAIGSMGWEDVAASYESPIYALVKTFPYVGDYLTAFVGFAAFVLCYSSSNTGLIGVSRLTASMSKFRLLPSWFRVINPRFRTPVRSIVFFGLVGVFLSLLGDVPLLASVYAFAAVFSYVILALTFIKIRNINREVYIPWKQPLNIVVAGREIPLLGVIGTVGLSVVFIFMLLFYSSGRVFGLIWMGVGTVFYVLYRQAIGAPILGRREASMIEPLAYRMRIGVLVRPYENPSTAINSIVHALDRRFDIGVVSIVEPPLNDDGKVLEDVRRDIEGICRKLKNLGYRAEHVVVAGEFEQSVSSMLDEGRYDLVAYIQRRPEKSIFEKGHEKNIHNLITRYPGRIISLKRVGE